MTYFHAGPAPDSSHGRLGGSRAGECPIGIDAGTGRLSLRRLTTLSEHLPPPAHRLSLQSKRSRTAQMTVINSQAPTLPQRRSVAEAMARNSAPTMKAIRCRGFLKFPTLDHRNSPPVERPGGPVRTLCDGLGRHLPGDQIGHGDRLVTVRAGAAQANPGHESPAVLAALVADRSGAAGAALIDGQRLPRPAGGSNDDRCRRRLVPALPGETSAGVGAELLSPRWGEEALAHRAGHRRRIVPQRGGVSHEGLPSNGACRPGPGVRACGSSRRRC